MRIREAVAAAVLALALPGATVIWDVQIDNRLERWQGHDPHAAETYREFKQTFGSDEFVLLALWDAPLFETDTLAGMLEATEKIEKIPGVSRVAGIPIVYRDLFDSEDPESLAEEMTSTPFYEGIYISTGELSTAIIITIEPPAEPSGRREIMRRIRSATGPMTEAGFSVGLVGPTVLIDALDRLSESESRRAFAIALVASLLALAALSRSLKAMCVAGCCSLVTIVLTMALVVVTDHSLNMITSVLPALLWVLSLSGAIHLVRRYRHHRWSSSAKEAVSLSLADTTRPMVLAAVTTAAGFASLLAADMDPVRELGMFAAIGILLSLVVNLSVGPILIRLIGVPPAKKANDLEFHGRWLHLGANHHRITIMIAALVVVVCFACLPLIEVASNPLGFLPEDHPTLLDYVRVGESLAGFYTLEIVLELPSHWTEPSHWPAIDALARRLDTSPIVTRTVSPLDMLRKLEHWHHEMAPETYRLPATRNDAEERLADLDEEALDRLASMVSSDGANIRVSAMVNEMDEHRFLELVDDANTALNFLPPGITGSVTGQVLLLVNAQQSLVSTQVRSLFVALGVVFVVIGAGLRFSRLTLLSALPNILPLLVAFAVMGVAGLALDAATVMVASVALGIAVDDTVHLLVAITREQGAGDAAHRVGRALEHVAPALVLTTFAACIGFFSLAWSAFVPIKYFGLLAGIAMLTALVADLWLVPALLSARRWNFFDRDA